MHYAPVPDVVGPGFLLGLGIGLLCGSTITILLTTLVEAGVMVLIKWGDFRQSFGAALLMNIISTVLGVVLVFVLNSDDFNTLAYLVMAYLLSLLVEFAILMLVRHKTLLQNLIAIFAANTISYILIGGLALLFNLLIL